MRNASRSFHISYELFNIFPHPTGCRHFPSHNIDDADRFILNMSSTKQFKIALTLRLVEGLSGKFETRWERFSTRKYLKLDNWSLKPWSDLFGGENMFFYTITAKHTFLIHPLNQSKIRMCRKTIYSGLFWGINFYQMFLI